MFSASFAEAIASDRSYHAWSIEMSPDNMVILLGWIDEFAQRWKLLAPHVQLPTLDPHSGKGIMLHAIKALYDVLSGAKTPTPNKVHNGYVLTPEKCAFTMEFRERLRNGTQASWACDLNEVNASRIFWLIGLYGIRAVCWERPNRPHPCFQGPAELVAPVRLALSKIVQIYNDERRKVRSSQ
jgi:hypothetical protein